MRKTPTRYLGSTQIIFWVQCFVLRLVTPLASHTFFYFRSLLNGKCHFKIANQRVVFKRHCNNMLWHFQTIFFPKIVDMNVFSPYIWDMLENIWHVSFILEAQKLHGLILQFLMDIFCFFVLFQLISWVLWMGLTVVPIIPTSWRFSWFAGVSCMGGCARSC